MMFKLIHGAFVYHFNVYELMMHINMQHNMQKTKAVLLFMPLISLTVFSLSKLFLHYKLIHQQQTEREWQRERKNDTERERELYSTGTKPSVSCQQLQLLNGQTATNTLKIQQYAIKHTSTLAASLIKTALKCNNIIIDHFLNRQQITRAHTLIV